MMNSDINIECWSKTLGYESTSEPGFHESWKKLVPPAKRDVWRHIISQVLPAHRANYIRKHCLLYNLELKEKINQDIKLEANVRSSKDYNKYMKITSLNVHSAYLSDQVNERRTNIMELQSKLEFLRSKNEEKRKKEKEQLIKCKLIKLKVNATNEEIERIKEMQILFNLFTNSSPTELFTEEHGRWGKEVIDCCKSYHKGQEFQQLFEKLNSLLQTKIKNKTENKRENKDTILQEMQVMQINKTLEADILRQNYNKLMQNIEALKERITLKFEEVYGDLQQGEVLEYVISSYTQDIFNTVEMEALKNLQKSWNVNRNCSKTNQYAELKREISRLDGQIESKTNGIITSLQGQKKLIDFCINAANKIKEEPKDNISKIKSVHKQIVLDIKDLNFLPREIELFLRTSIRSVDHQESSLQSTNPSVLQCMKKVDVYNHMASELNTDSPSINKNADVDIRNFKKNELKAEEKLKRIYKTTKHLIDDIRYLHSSTEADMEYWKQQPLAEGSPSCSEEYPVWRKRCKEAMETIRMCSSDDVSSVDISSTSASTSQ